jgi:hypothetical protein
MHPCLMMTCHQAPSAVEDETLPSQTTLSKADYPQTRLEIQGMSSSNDSVLPHLPLDSPSKQKPARRRANIS